MTFELEDIFAHTEDFTTFKHKPKVFNKSLKWLLGLALTVGCVGGAGALAGNNPRVEKAIKEMENEATAETKVTVTAPIKTDKTETKKKSKKTKGSTATTRPFIEAFNEICKFKEGDSNAIRLCDEYKRGLAQPTVTIRTSRHN